MTLNIPFENVQFASAGTIVYPPGSHYGPRIQKDIQLVMLYTGEMDITIDGRNLHVLPGQMVLLKPRHKEMFTFSKTEETWHCWISVRVSPLSEEIIHILDQLPEILPLSDEMNALTELMLNFQRYLSRSDTAVLNLGLAALHLYPTELKRLQQQSEKHPAILSALSWMNVHFAEDISLNDIVIQTNVSPEHLIRLFKQHEGTTPIQYLWKYRVTRAIELLMSTGLTISEISECCGFKTPAHFARLIKQYKGKTASEIRQLSWERHV
ncbi:AraC family transcriptional regulator [Paenibacillus roseipurpureus]|uniref:AraC family transcriptional regulator n=1 Tax=Paenibacillus roseopurpureus TaxID=2918901 RepID=A0AA96LNW3_9BACL|nr:AraC family transcriptional regulator [Paenibacillus sp. MBLB1832]WNR43976.1 AraC family transcriptional regulator [Paenibacillus sp. MBLB1832]